MADRLEESRLPRISETHQQARPLGTASNGTGDAASAKLEAAAGFVPPNREPSAQSPERETGFEPATLGLGRARRSELRRELASGARRGAAHRGTWRRRERHHGTRRHQQTPPVPPPRPRLARALSGSRNEAAKTN